MNRTSAPRSSGWRKSTRSADSGNGNCVEARATPTGFEVRDSKLGDDSPVLGMTEAGFAGLIEAIKSGEID